MEGDTHARAGITRYAVRWHVSASAPMFQQRYRDTLLVSIPNVLLPLPHLDVAFPYKYECKVENATLGKHVKISFRLRIPVFWNLKEDRRTALKMDDFYIRETKRPSTSIRRNGFLVFSLKTKNVTVFYRIKRMFYEYFFIPLPHLNKTRVQFLEKKFK